MSASMWCEIKSHLDDIISNKTLPHANWKYLIHRCCSYIRSDEFYPVTITNHLREFMEEKMSRWEESLRSCQCNLLAGYAEAFWEFYLFCRQVCDIYCVHMAHISKMRDQLGDRYDDFAPDRMFLLQWKVRIIDSFARELTAQAIAEICEVYRGGPLRKHVSVFLFSLIAVDNDIEFARGISYKEMIAEGPSSIVRIFMWVKEEIHANDKLDGDQFEEHPAESLLVLTDTYGQLFTEALEGAMAGLLLAVEEDVQGVDDIERVMYIDDLLFRDLIYDHNKPSLRNYIYNGLFARHREHFRALFSASLLGGSYQVAFKLMGLFERSEELLADMGALVRHLNTKAMTARVEGIPPTAASSEAAQQFVDIVDGYSSYFGGLVRSEFRDHPSLLFSLENAVRDVVNSSQSVGPLPHPLECISLHVHNLLSAGRPIPSLAVVCTIRNLSLFFDRYRHYLLLRLREGGFSLNIPLELDTLDTLQAALGSTHLSAIRAVISEVHNPLQAEFGLHPGVPPYFHPLVFSRVPLPSREDVSIAQSRLPAELREVIANFSQFYRDKFAGVEIEFQLAFGSVELEVVSLEGQVVSLLTNITQAALLLMMGEQASLEDLARHSELEQSLILHFCSPLINAGILVSEGQVLRLNHSFNVPPGVLDCQSEGTVVAKPETVEGSCPDESKWNILAGSAFIARHIKCHGSATHEELWTICQSHNLNATYDVFREAEEYLIAKEIISRTPEDSFAYNA